MAATKENTAAHREILRGLPQELRMDLSAIVDQAVGAGRMHLAVHRMAEKDSLTALVAWQGFNLAHDAAESLSYLLELGPCEFE